MNGKVNFSKIQNCNQVWEDMELCQAGRKCSKCSHIITDFRGMSEWEIAVIHANSDQKVCGLYDNKFFGSAKTPKFRTQLGRLSLPTVFSLLSLTISTDSSAQIAEPQEQIDSIKNNKYNTKEKTEHPKTISDSTKIIRGFIYDEYSEPIIGGNIVAEGTNYGTITERDGSFTLDVTNELRKESAIVLIVSYTGYGKQYIEVANKDFNNKIELSLQPIVIHGNEMITSFGIKRESLPKRVWRGIKNIFRKKK